MSDFVSYPLFGFILVITLRNFDFEGQNTLVFVDKKNDVRFEYENLVGDSVPKQKLGGGGCTL